MKTKHVKSFILISLAVINVLMLIGIVNLRYSKRNLPQSMIEDAENFLRSEGLYIKPGVIPAERPNFAVYDGSFGREMCEDVVKAISGTEIQQAFPLPSGGMDYISGDIRARFYDAGNSGSFMYATIYDVKYSGIPNEDDQIAALLESVPIKVSGGLSSSSARAAKRAVDAFLRSISPEAPGYEIAGALERDGMLCLRLVQVTEGLDIHDHNALVIISGDKVVLFSGLWFFYGFDNAYRSVSLIDSVNILLMTFTKEKQLYTGKTLTGMTLSYNLIWYEQDIKFYMLPSWELHFGDEVFIYNALTGGRISANTG